MAIDPFKMNNGGTPPGGWNNGPQPGPKPTAGGGSQPVGGGIGHPGAGGGGPMTPSGPVNFTPGAGPALTPSSSPTQVQQQAQGGRGGTGFVNLSRILGMNAGGGARVGNAIAGDAAGKAKNAQQEMAGAFNDFQGQVNQGYNPADFSGFTDKNGQFNPESFATPHPAYVTHHPTEESQRDQFNGMFDSFTGGHGGAITGNAPIHQFNGVPPPQPDYVDPVLQGQINDAQHIADSATYGGPEADQFSSSAGFDKASKDLADAQARIKALDDQGGLQSAIREKYGNTGAQSAFDSLLVGRGNKAIGQVEDQYNAKDGNAFNNLSKLMDFYQGKANDAVAGKKASSQSDADKANDIIKGWTEYLNSHKPHYV
jgi:hypothetical protein